LALFSQTENSMLDEGELSTPRKIEARVLQGINDAPQHQVHTSLQMTPVFMPLTAKRGMWHKVQHGLSSM
jgi:hypothetical protein